MATAPFRRIVTGHDDSGKAVVQEEGPPPRTLQIGGESGPVFYEVWNTRATPAPIDRRSGEPEEAGIVLAPPRNGTRIRVVDFLPGSEPLEDLKPEDARALFEQIGAADASTHGKGSATHATMHRTETIDYGIVLQGEIALILDEEETIAHAGDIIVQRGTNHGWVNRSDEVCRIAFVLIDAVYEDGLA